MPDFGTNASGIFGSRILGSALEDTPYNQGQIGGMMGGMQPEQLQQFFANPQVQQQFAQYGIDPQAMMQHVRQSPFLPNQFMQHHPRLGGALTGMMSNVAATPAAPLVSGAGSGMSRAMQGMMGGPEMLRQYQMQQMMGPMGAMGAMMPMQGEARRRAIEEAIVQQAQNRPEEMERDRQAKEQLELEKQQFSQPKVTMGPIGTGMTTQTFQQPTPQQPPQQGIQPGLSPMQTQGAVGPGMPAQQGGWQQQYQPYDQGQMQGQFHAKSTGLETPADTNLKNAKANEANARAFLGIEEGKNVKAGKGRGGNLTGEQRADQNSGKRYESVEKQAMGEWLAIDSGQGDDQSKNSQKAAVKDWLDNQKKSIDQNYQTQIQHAGGSSTDLPKQVSPGAKAPKSGAANKPPAAQQTAPPRPPNVPSNYEFKQGPQGLGWYNPKPKPNATSPTVSPNAQ